MSAIDITIDTSMPEVLDAFVAYLRPRLASATVATMFRNLNAMLRVMYPDLDRPGLKHGVACLEAQANPRATSPRESDIAGSFTRPASAGRRRRNGTRNSIQGSARRAIATV